MLGSYLCPSAAVLRFAAQQAVISIPCEEVKRVPNPLDNPVWVAKMVAWLALVLFDHAAHKHMNGTMVINTTIVIMKVTHPEAVCRSYEIPSALRTPLSDYLAQLYADYNPYAMDETDQVEQFMNDYASAFLAIVKRDWGIVPDVEDSEQTVWRFDWH